LLRLGKKRKGEPLKPRPGILSKGLAVKGSAAKTAAPTINTLQKREVNETRYELIISGELRGSTCLMPGIFFTLPFAKRAAAEPSAEPPPITRQIRTASGDLLLVGYQRLALLISVLNARHLFSLG